MVAREATDLYPITSSGLFAGWNPAAPIPADCRHQFNSRLSCRVRDCCLCRGQGLSSNCWKSSPMQPTAGSARWAVRVLLLSAVNCAPERKEGKTALGSIAALAPFIGADCHQKWRRTRPFRAGELESIVVQWVTRGSPMAWILI